MNSRDENMNIVDIYKRIEDRNDKEINLLRNHVSDLHQVINELKEVVKKEESEIDSNLILKTDKILSHSSSMHSDYLVESTASNLVVKKLALPHTIKDARKISDSFVNGLICPFVNRNPADGYAYILPSDVLPVAIASGMNFEHITDNYEISELHERSMFRSPDIKNQIDKMLNLENQSVNMNLEDSNYDTLNVAIGLWSDGCDAGGASKANRSLVKLTTIYVTNPLFDESHVFPIAFGSNNHEMI